MRPILLAIGRQLARPWLFVIVVSLLLAIPALYLSTGPRGSFNSPDETAAFSAARQFAEAGRFYERDELTMADEEGLIKQRGYVNYRGRAVTLYPLGHPLLLGLVRRAFGDNSGIALAAMPALTAMALGLVIYRLTGGRRILITVAPVLALPAWYWASQVYFNMSGYLLFFSWGFLLFVIAAQKRSLCWYFAGAAFFAIASLMRYQDAIITGLIGLAFAAQLAWRERRLSWKVLGAGVGAYAAAQLMLFLLPATVLHWWTFGNPLTYGLQIFNERWFPERLGHGASGLLGVLFSVKVALLPSDISMATAGNGILRQVIQLAPALTVLGVAGVFMMRRAVGGTISPWAVGLSLLAVAYLIVSRANPDAFGAQISQPLLKTAFTRHFSVIYAVLGISAAFFLSRFRDKWVAGALAVILVASGTTTLWVQYDAPFGKIPSHNSWALREYGQPIAENTEDNAIIYTGILDKWVTPIRRVAAWWWDEHSEGHFSAPEVASSAERVHRLGYPVYFYLTTEPVDELRRELSRKGFELVPIEIDRRNFRLWGMVTTEKFTDRNSSSRHPGNPVCCRPSATYPLPDPSGQTSI